MKEKQLRGFKIGDIAELVHTITQSDIDRFVELTGDNNPLHVDSAFAERTSMKGIVAHGMLGASFISTIIGKHIPGEGALWVSQTLRFLLPVRIGDIIRVKAEVVDIHTTQNILELSIEIVNQNAQKVLTGESQVKVLEEAVHEDKDHTEKSKRAAIITGSSRGIGAAIAKRLAQDGFSVVVNYNSDKHGAEKIVSDIVSSGGNAIALQADITNSLQVKKLIDTTIKHYGGISVLVNNATGEMINKGFLDLTEEDIESYTNIHFKAPLNMIKLVLPHMIQAGEGDVVNIATIYTDNVPPNGLLAYTSTKAALASATRSLAVEFGPQGIRFNIVSPGMTDTRLIANTPEKARLLNKMQTPLRRLAQPEDIANGVAFLVSEQARHITGETLRICGGSIMI